jgi:hypothetical protein
MKNFRVPGTLFIAVLLVFTACENPAGGGDGGEPPHPVPVSGTVTGLDDLLDSLNGEPFVEIRDAEGDVVTRVEVDSDGSWSAQIPPAYKGSDLTMVIVIHDGGGDRVFEGGTITINADGSVSGTTAISAPDPDNFYTITKSAETNGSFTVSPSNAIAGEVVTVTATPGSGYTAGGVNVTAGGTPVDTEKTGNNTWRFIMPGSNDVTVTVTFDLIPVTVNVLNLSGLVARPVKGGTPDIAGINETQYTGTIAWQTENGAAHTGDFVPAAVYKAVVTLTAKTGYTFEGLGTNSFSHNGAVSVANGAGSGVVTITFPATEEHDPNTGIPIGNPSVQLYLDGDPVSHNGSSVIELDAEAAAVSIGPGTYSEIIWYVNGSKAAEGADKTSVNLPRRTAGTFYITVEAVPAGGVKNSGAHTFVIE